MPICPQCSAAITLSESEQSHCPVCKNLLQDRDHALETPVENEPPSDFEAESKVQESIWKLDVYSWLVCTFGLAFLLALGTYFLDRARAGAPGPILALLIAPCALGIYLQIPYLIYFRQVNRNYGCLSMLLFLAMTGIFPGYILLLIWDVMRFVLALIFRPSAAVKYFWFSGSSA